MKKITYLVILSLLLFFSTCKGGKKSDKESISILTGGKTGNYYKAANELNDVLKNSDFQLAINESPGSFKNIAQLGSGKTDLAIAQFDVILVYVALGKEFQKLANESHVVAPLNFESVHIIVNKKSGIKSFKDLVGKKIAVGPKHSGSWISAWNLMITLNKVNIEKTKNIFKEAYKDSMEKLIKGEIDAMFITTTTGMPFLKNLPASHGSSIAILSMGSSYRIPSSLKTYYRLEKIPGNTYTWEKNEVYTLATPSYLLANSNYSSSKVKKLSGEIFKNADGLKSKSKIWNLLSESKVKSDIKNKIPYHKGVRMYLGLN